MSPLLNLLGATLFLVPAPIGTCAAPARDGDRVQAGTVWKGKLTQNGAFKGQGGAALEFDCVFTVTKRNGDRFEAELTETAGYLRLTYLVRGTVRPLDKRAPKKGHAVEFESVDAKEGNNGAAVTRVPYLGTAAGRQLKGTWKYTNDGGTALEGTFAFELTKKE